MKTHSKKKKYIAFDRKTFKSVNIAKKLSMQPSPKRIIQYSISQNFFRGFPEKNILSGSTFCIQKLVSS